MLPVNITDLDVILLPRAAIQDQGTVKIHLSGLLRHLSGPVIRSNGLKGSRKV